MQSIRGAQLRHRGSEALAVDARPGSVLELGAQPGRCASLSVEMGGYWELRVLRPRFGPWRMVLDHRTVEFLETSGATGGFRPRRRSGETAHPDEFSALIPVHDVEGPALGRLANNLAENLSASLLGSPRQLLRGEVLPSVIGNEASRGDGPGSQKRNEQLQR